MASAQQRKDFLQRSKTLTAAAGKKNDLAAVRRLLDVDKAATQVSNMLQASAHLMTVLARACGHDALAKFAHDDLVTASYDMARLSGVRYAGVGFHDGQS